MTLSTYLSYVRMHIKTCIPTTCATQPEYKNPRGLYLAGFYPHTYLFSIRKKKKKIVYIYIYNYNTLFIRERA